MIALLACVVLAPWRVIESVEPQANRVSIQALVKIPSLGSIDMAKLNVIVQAIPKQTQDYPRREMLMVTDGEQVRCELTPDHIRFVVNIPPGRVKTGLGVMAALLENATLTQENLDAAALEKPIPDYWSAALDPVELPTVKVNAAEAQVLYHRVFRPERVLLTVGGKFTSGEAEQEWTNRMDHWQVEREPKGFFDVSEPKERIRNPGPVTTIDLVAAPVTSGDAALPSRILSLFALGVGKGSSLFRVVRQKRGWSYRQDAILSPTKDGWVPRLLIASIPTDDTAVRVKTIKADLLEDIGSWTMATRARAIGMAEAVLANHVPYSPLYVLGNSPVGFSLEDRTFLAGYWLMKTGQAWDPAALIDSMKKVSLEDLKEQATAILTTAIPRVLPGTG